MNKGLFFFFIINCKMTQSAVQANFSSSHLQRSTDIFLTALNGIRIAHILLSLLLLNMDALELACKKQ